MTAQVGMPVEYTKIAGEGSYPALVTGVDGSGNVASILAPIGGTPQWQQNADGLVRDDTGASSNSWRPVNLSGTASIQSGV